MSPNAPLGMMPIPKFAEGSALAPARDDRNVGQLWKKASASNDQIQASLQSLQKAVRVLSGQRRRIVGGFTNEQQTFDNIDPMTIYQAPAVAPIVIEAVGSGYTVNDVLTVSGGTGTPTQLAATRVTSAGAIVEVQIITQGSYTVPPTYPNSPTGGTGVGFSFSAGTSADLWRTFQIRDGLVGARSRYWLDGVDFGGGNNPFPSINVASGLYVPFIDYNYQFGNGETMLPVIGDVQGIGAEAPNGQPTTAANCIKIQSNVDTLIGGMDAGGSWVSFPQVMMCDFSGSFNPATVSRAAMSFWVEIVDDPVKGFGANLYCRMCGGDTASPTFPTMSAYPFPQGPNIIPIGYVDARFQLVAVGPITPLNVTDFYQKLSGDATFRFPQYGSNDTALFTNASDFGNSQGKALFMRGAWTQNNLTHQVFYPGDVVLDDSLEIDTVLAVTGGSGGSVTVKSYGVYICLGDDNGGLGSTSLPFLSDVAPNADSRWKLLCNRLKT